jgi:hypothetical protein
MVSGLIDKLIVGDGGPGRETGGAPCGPTEVCVHGHTGYQEVTERAGTVVAKNTVQCKTL